MQLAFITGDYFTLDKIEAPSKKIKKAKDEITRDKQKQKTKT